MPEISPYKYVAHSPEKKASWGLGEWQNEQDQYFWIDPTTRYNCAIIRGHSGQLCGYAQIKSGPLLGVTLSYNESKFEIVKERQPPKGIIPTTVNLTDFKVVHTASFNADIRCHYELDYCCLDAEQKTRWFGFHCSHIGDYVPNCKPNEFTETQIYRNYAYTHEKVTQMALDLCNLSFAFQTQGLDDLFG